MGLRGRKSAASLSIVSMIGHERPAPPDELTEDEAKEWREIAARMPHDWFTRENQPLLAEYARHIVRARILAQDVNKFRTYPAEVRLTLEGLQRYDSLLRMADRERAAIVNLATKMRLTQQSRYTEQKAARTVKPRMEAVKPWEKAG